MRRTHERGFTLIESLVTIALTSVVVLGIATAVLQSMRASNRTLVRSALGDDALNVLSDIRVATAYDADALAQLTGKSSTATVVRDGRSLTVAISVTRANATAPVVAHVTVADQDGERVSEEQQLFHEAPMPGSVIDAQSGTAPTPPPAPPSRFGTAHEAAPP